MKHLANWTVIYRAEVKLRLPGSVFGLMISTALVSKSYGKLSGLVYEFCRADTDSILYKILLLWNMIQTMITLKAMMLSRFTLQSA